MVTEWQQLCEITKTARRPRIRRGGEQGQDAVEFALIFPILFLIVLAILDLGRATYYISALHNAAREGARFASVFPDDEEAILQVVRNFTIGMDEAAVTPDVEYPDEDTVRVTVTYNMTLVNAILFGGPYTLSSQSTVAIEH
jgi:Flp pilus assembly protein TadG